MWDGGFLTASLIMRFDFLIPLCSVTKLIHFLLYHTLFLLGTGLKTEQSLFISSDRHLISTTVES